MPRGDFLMHFYYHLLIYLLVVVYFFFKFHLQHKFIEKCNTGASKMLAKIKDAKRIRATLAAQSQLDGPDDVCHTHTVICI